LLSRAILSHLIPAAGVADVEHIVQHECLWPVPMCEQATYRSHAPATATVAVMPDLAAVPMYE